MAELGDVQLRWVTPVSGLTNRQSAAMMSRLDGELWNDRATLCWSSARW